MKRDRRSTKWFIALFLATLHVSAAQDVEDGEFGHARWTYESNAVDKTVYTAHSPITLTYVSELDGTVVDNSQVQFSVDERNCFQPAPGSPTILECESVGEKTIRVDRGDPNTVDTFSIDVKSKNNCFEWYVATDYSDEFRARTVPENMNSTMRIWVLDVNTASEEELSGSAKVPSEDSKALTRGFFVLGEEPSITMPDYVKLRLEREATVDSSVIPRVLRPVFSQEEGYWTYQFDSHGPEAAALTISGLGVAILNCAVRNQTITLNVADTWTFLEPWLQPLPQTPSIEPIAVQDPCSMNIAVVNLGMPKGFLVTFNGFEETRVVQTPHVGGDTLFVANTAYSLLSVTTTTVYVSDDASGTQVGDGLPVVSTPQQVNRVVSINTCNFLDTLGRKWDQAAFSATWREDVEGVSNFFLTQDAGKTYREAILSNSTLYHIYSVAIHISYPTFVVTATDLSTGKDQLLIYDYENDATQPTAVEFGTKITDSPYVGSLVSMTGSGEMLVWGTQLFYSPNGGVSVVEVPLLSRQTGTMSMMDGEFIQRVVSSRQGNFAVMTTEKRLFYGAFGVREAMELQSGMSPDSHSDIIFNSRGQLEVLTYDPNPPYIHVRQVPVMNEMASRRFPLAVNPTLPCPFRDLDTSGILSGYYLDMEESFEFTARLVPLEGYSDQLSISVSDRFKLQFEISSQVNLYNDVTERLTRATFSEAEYEFRDFLDRVTVMKGETDIRISPVDSNLACNPVQRVSRVRVGCPPNRHIRVRPEVDAETQHCDAYKPGGSKNRYSVTEAELEMWPDLEDVDRGNLVYDYDKYGCPLRVFHGTKGYRPTIDIYDGDVMLRELDGLFAMWEVNGRTDWEFNATGSAMGCKSGFQVWNDFDGQVREQAWGPWNYISCFGDNDLQSHDLFPLLNSSGHNAIVFSPIGIDGLFIFRIKVLSPESSYCELTADVALAVYGAPLPLVTSVMIIGICTLILLLFLGGSYFWYKHTKYKRE